MASNGWRAPLWPAGTDGADGAAPSSKAPNSSTLRARLAEYEAVIRRLILARQDPVTGLLPASTAVNEHGDYRYET